MEVPEDDILFEFDAEYLEHNVSTNDPFDASEFDFEGEHRLVLFPRGH